MSRPASRNCAHSGRSFPSARKHPAALNSSRQAPLAHPFFTIGHATRSIADFVALLQEAEIELVADVRTVPRSRRNPQYNRDVLPTSLASFDLGYMHVPELGGLRKHSPVPRAVNSFWENESFHNYADYLLFYRMLRNEVNRNLDYSFELSEIVFVNSATPPRVQNLLTQKFH